MSLQKLNLSKHLCAVLFSLTILGAAGCSKSDEDVTKWFQQKKTGNSPDYAIEKRSVVDPMAWDHTITVHGFAYDGNRTTCNDIVSLLTKANRLHSHEYRCVQLNK